MKTIALVIILLISMLFIISCKPEVREVQVIKEVPIGISQADYDRVVTQLEQANKKIKELEAELELANKDIEQEQEPVERTSELTPIKEWSGQATKTTEPFTVKKSPWAIAWSNNPTSSMGGYLSIRVLGVGGEYIDMIANTTAQGTDSSYIYETGTFYLEINAANTKWLVRIYQQQ